MTLIWKNFFSSSPYVTLEGDSYQIAHFHNVTGVLGK